MRANTKAFKSSIDQWIKDTGKKFSEVVVETRVAVGTDIINKTPVVTGKARDGWTSTINQPGESSESGTDPITLLNNVAQQNPSNNFYLVNTVPYINMLEYGHSQQAPNGMVRIAVANFNRTVEDIVKAKP